MQEAEGTVHKKDHGAYYVGGRPVCEIHGQIKGKLNQNPPQTVPQDISAAIHDFQPGRKRRSQTAGHDMEEKRYRDVEKQAGAHCKIYVYCRIRGCKNASQKAADGNKKYENMRQNNHETSSFFVQMDFSIFYHIMGRLKSGEFCPIG
jgi:hypothetical protein